MSVLALFAYTAAARPQLPPLTSLAQAPWWVWVGGLLGGVFVTAAAAFAPRLQVDVLLKFGGSISQGRLLHKLERFHLAGHQNKRHSRG